MIVILIYHYRSTTSHYPYKPLKQMAMRNVSNGNDTILAMLANNMKCSRAVQPLSLLHVGVIKFNIILKV